MRLTVLVLSAALTCAAGTAWASPILSEPPSTGNYGWADNEARTFSLARVGTGYTLSVQGLGTSQYSTLTQCCTDVFGRVLALYPGGTLHFTSLALNTLPTQTEFWDDLNLTALKRAGLDNLGTLTGLVTLDVPDTLSRGARTLDFTVQGFEDGPLQPMEAPASVPEPATLLLVGAGLLGLGRLVARRA